MLCCNIQGACHTKHLPNLIHWVQMDLLIVSLCGPKKHVTVCTNRPHTCLKLQSSYSGICIDGRVKEKREFYIKTWGEDGQRETNTIIILIIKLKHQQAEYKLNSPNNNYLLLITFNMSKRE